MRSRVLLLICLAGLLGPAPIFSQSLRGSISGVVTDAAGAPLPAARVSLVHQQTNKERNTTTDAQGRFLESLLPTGVYSLRVEQEGYRTHLQEVTLQINQDLWVEVPLLMGSLTHEVEVTSSRALLTTESARVSTTIDNEQITHLPLDGRNFAELTLLVPGTVPAAPGSAGSVRGDFALNVNGARDTSNQFLLDGVYNGDPTLNGVGVIPPVDAIQEFEVLTSSYEASFGRNAGGQVNVALKGGTNGFHGTIYEFFRHDALDARHAFAPAIEPNPTSQRNQFGVSLGGPLKRDRTFFFGDYEGRALREGVTRITNVPGERERLGDFSQSPLPPIDPLTGMPFTDGVIPDGWLSPIGLAIASLYPLPNRATPGQNFASSPARRDHENHFDLRLDHETSPAADFAARYSFSDRDLFEPFSGALFSNVPGYGTDIRRRAQNLLLSETRAFSSRFLNELRFGFHRIHSTTFHENSGNSLNAEVGLPEVADKPRDFGLSFIRVTGFSPLGDEFNNPQGSTSNTFQVLDHATLICGGQQLQFGFDFRSTRQTAFRDVQARGFLNFLGLTGNPLADLLLGLPALTGRAEVDNRQKLRAESYSIFFQDNVQLRPGLTLTAGLRYEYHSPPVDADDRATTYDPGTQSLVPVGTDGVPRSGYRSDWNNWGPRVGLAWSPWKGRGTVLRAGYGVYYEQAELAPGEGLYFNPPFFQFSLFFPLPGLPLDLSDPFPSSFPFVLPASALAYQRDLDTAYVQHWSFTVQQAFGAARVLEIGYVGSKGTSLLSARDFNQPPASPVIPNPRPVPQFSDINLVESRASSTYNSLQVRFQQSHDFGLSLLTSYTWSKSIDDASSFFSSAGDPNFPQDAFNLKAERGRSNFDVRHRFTLGYGYELPFGPGKRWGGRGWTSYLIGGWQTYSVVVAQTGYPFTVSILPELDISNTGQSILGFGSNDRPNVVGNPHLGSRSAAQWFNAAAFEFPPFGSFGNSGRNTLEGPGFQTINFSLLKKLPLGESKTLEFRTEIFNLLNHTNLDLPDNFLGSPSFGQILSAQDPRRIQLGVKFLF